MIPQLWITTWYGRTHHGVQMESSTLQIKLLLLTITVPSIQLY